MTWIRTIPMDQADARLRDAMRFRELYPPEYGAPVPALPPSAGREAGGSITDSHTLLPDAMYHAFALFGSLMQPDLPLSRMQHEMIATVVSVANDCFY